ncbi:BA75_03753T0 [Komagataella pastoris]|uniref:BA75_03753T0 n=1 Tax=Komagataella pastoris TaxID=4922 RepID=A0A1B2JG15_PICPA|nr:BA75_03753T0 [Komagataella pastoris]
MILPGAPRFRLFTRIPRASVRATRFAPGFISRSLSSASPGKPKAKSKFVKFVAVFLATGSFAYYADNKWAHSAVTRTVRSLSVLTSILIDYKLHFNVDDDISSLHERSATKLLELIVSNKGLYVKVGQIMALQSAIFPKEFREKFRHLYDQAPRDDWSEVDGLLAKELGDDYREKFSSIDEIPIASASIAQVHEATLLDGTKVILKVQHPAIAHQLELDLFTFKNVLRLYEWVFEVPLSFSADYIIGEMRKEVDFKVEYNNTITFGNLVNNSEFKDAIAVPRLYSALSTSRLITMEYIEGISLVNSEAIKASSFDVHQLLEVLIRCYAKQIYSWGFFHADPHPGNFIVRRLEDNRQQLVVIDFGLCISLTDDFRRTYSDLWRAILELDYDKLAAISKKWGIQSTDMFVAMTSMSTRGVKDLEERAEKIKNLSNYEKQLVIRDNLVNFFENSDKFPQCLSFIARSMRMIQLLNYKYGSKVNRLKIFNDELTRALKEDVVLKVRSNLDKPSFRLSLLQVYRYAVFTIVKLVINLVFNFYRLRSAIFSRFNKQVNTFEQELESQMLNMGNNFGLQLEKGDLFLDNANNDWR